jgi:hypothetical protein
MNIKNFIVENGKKLIDISVGIELILALILSIFVGIALPVIGFIITLPILLILIIISNYLLYLLIDISENIKILTGSKK